MKLALAAVAAFVLSASPAAAVPAHERAVSASVAKAIVKVSESVVTEGDRLTLRVRVPQAGDASRVVLQERRIDILGTPRWSDVASKHAKRRLRFRHTVTGVNEAVYRVAVTYRGRSAPKLSRTAKVTVWRWVPLAEFPAYYTTSSLVGNGSDTMNGRAFQTWGLHYSITTPRSWEARITPGRNCTRFRAAFGLSDRSDDGSSGFIALTADDAPIYQSHSLTPGMTTPVELELSKPYRIGMSAVNTSAEKVRAYPMVGNGEFYCTGIPA